MAGEQQAATALAPPDPAVPPPGEGYQAREGMAAYFVAVVFKMSAGSNFARSPFSCGRGELCLFDPPPPWCCWLAAGTLQQKHGLSLLQQQPVWLNFETKAGFLDQKHCWM